MRAAAGLPTDTGPCWRLSGKKLLNLRLSICFCASANRRAGNALRVAALPVQVLCQALRPRHDVVAPTRQNKNPAICGGVQSGRRELHKLPWKC